MSEDSKQLSVAELLARNGQQGSASSGGRRRRSGRGISVAELTGDLPVIREGGHSAHSAPDSGASEEPAYERPSFDPPAPEPVSYAPPEPAPDPSSYSPMSGPISMYDPLAAYGQSEPRRADPEPGRSNRVMPGREMPSSRHATPVDPLSPHTPVSDLYPVAPDPYVTDAVPGGSLPEAPPRASGRRRRHAEPEEGATEVRPPLRELPPESGGRRWADHGAASGALPEFGPGDGRPGPDREGHAEFGESGLGRADRGRSSLPERNGAMGGRAARRRAKEAEEAGSAPAAWSPSTNGFAPESDPLPLPETRPKLPDRPPESQPRSSRRNGAGDGDLPAWSARRRASSPPRDSAPESGGIPTAAWSLASQDQQLVSGQTVAGDLLRDGVERAERGKRGRGERETGRSRVEVYEGATDVYAPILDVDDEDDEDEVAEQPRTRAMSARRSRMAEKATYDANRRQWMILGGQSTGAAVAGMLLFKGFERMWEMLPWVALALAMIVILGLVALVRILRRTDDILSTVIAVVVGSFVTLGPLAFLLSTN
ncbi:hypothetical protein OHB12_21905 [Nocardia sp. NBC_01730]|uniref:hypothetical protein n=1 Tax=Nocardia sp. NBC_01730 TaxID=2975998 RepID=UPI002E163B9D|nr:hypothetical protein OHB12_21905 [Nocardia sp. NBC_01730]